MQQLHIMMDLYPVTPVDNLMSWIDEVLAGRDVVFGSQQNPKCGLFSEIGRNQGLCHTNQPNRKASTLKSQLINLMPVLPTRFFDQHIVTAELTHKQMTIRRDMSQAEPSGPELHAKPS